MTIASKKKAGGQVIRLSLQSYHHGTLDEAVLEVLKAVTADAEVKYSGPIPLPSQKKRVTVTKAPNADKDARQQYEYTVHRRLIDIDFGDAGVERLKNLDLSADVKIEIKLQS